MLPGDYKRRTNSTQRNSAVTAGFASDAVLVSGNSQPTEVVQATTVVTLMSINTTSTNGVSVWFQDTNGTKQYIIQNATVARDYKMGFYCPWPVYVLTDANVTFYVSPPSKGNTTD